MQYCWSKEALPRCTLREYKKQANVHFLLQEYLVTTRSHKKGYKSARALFNTRTFWRGYAGLRRFVPLLKPQCDALIRRCVLHQPCMRVNSFSYGVRACQGLRTWFEHWRIIMDSGCSTWPIYSVNNFFFFLQTYLQSTCSTQSSNSNQQTEPLQFIVPFLGHCPRHLRHCPLVDSIGLLYNVKFWREQNKGIWFRQIGAKAPLNSIY